MRKKRSDDRPMLPFGDPQDGNNVVEMRLAPRKPRKQKKATASVSELVEQPTLFSIKTMTLADMWRTMGELRRAQYARQAAYEAARRKAAKVVQIESKNEESA